MRTRSILVLTVAGVLAVGGGAALAAETGEPAEGPPDHVLSLARGAAVQARVAAQDIAEEVAETGEPQGRDSQAFRDRHAALAEKHAAHPGNAAAVHAALAAGESPSTARGEHTPPGQAKQDDPEWMPPGQARQQERAAVGAARGALQRQPAADG